MKRGRRHPVLITDARRSQHDQLRSREIRYVLMMSFRALCLIAAAVLVGTHAPLLWLWIPICLVGMVVVPWLAVIIANDQPPRKRGREPVVAPPDPAPEAGPAALAPRGPTVIIDAEPLGDPAEPLGDPAEPLGDPAEPAGGPP